jgi:hypothetical protein
VITMLGSILVILAGDGKAFFPTSKRSVYYHHRPCGSKIMTFVLSERNIHAAFR